MKPINLLLVLAAAVAAAALASGCGDNSKTSQAINTVSNMVDAPVNYIGALGQAQKHAEKVIDVSYINQAIQLFNTQEGRLPKTLDELVPNYLGKLPAAPYGYQIVYDAAAGSVSVVKQ